MSDSVDAGLLQTCGYLRIAEVDSIDSERFRCDVVFPGTPGNKAKNAVIIPSPHFGFMPKKGTNVAMWSRPGVGNRVLFPLDIIDGRSADAVLKSETKTGNIPKMEVGDTYIGQAGRAYFGSNGDVNIWTKNFRCRVDLKGENGRTELTGYNFELSTPGKNVRIRSKSTVDAGPLMTWGDSLHLEVNTPLASATAVSETELVPTTLGKLDIDSTGAIDLEVLPFGVSAGLSMDITGAIKLGRGLPIDTVGLSISAVGLDKAELFTPLSGLTLNNGTGVVELENKEPTTKLTMDRLGNVTLGATTSYFKRDIAANSLTMKTAGGSATLFDTGDFTLTGKTVGISGTAASIQATSSATVAAPAINLEGAISLGVTGATLSVTLAEKLAPIWARLDAIMLLLGTHTHPVISPTITGPSAQLAPPVLQTPTFSSIGSSAVIGSATVKAVT